MATTTAPKIPKRISVEDLRATFGDDVTDKLIQGTLVTRALGSVEVTKDELEKVREYFEAPSPGNIAVASRIMRTYFQYMPFSRRAFLGWITKTLKTMAEEKETSFSLNGKRSSQKISLRPLTRAAKVGRKKRGK